MPAFFMVILVCGFPWFKTGTPVFYRLPMVIIIIAECINMHAMLDCHTIVNRGTRTTQ